MPGIYIHIPFCKQACSYCDFYFVTRKTDPAVFVKALCEEIRSYRDTIYADEPVQTLYLGGGTPSRLDAPMIRTIFKTLYSTFPCRQIEEVTMEMNPDDLNEEYLDRLVDLGITRASMGVQSFNPDLLRFMHRAHTGDEARRCLDMLAASNLPTYSVDLIYGNPGQSMKDLQSDLDILTGFNPPHVSAYSLTIEPKTRLGKQLALHRLEPLPDDAVSDQMDLIHHKLGKQGIEQYEVSNYARPGHRSLHNSGYWRHANYLGFGPSAHSFWWRDDTDQACRWFNEAQLERYIKSPVSARTGQEVLSHHKLAEERIMISLRTTEGIDLNELDKRYEYILTHEQLQYLNKLVDQQILQNSGNQRFQPTPQGLKVADRITLDLITRHDERVVSRES